MRVSRYVGLFLGLVLLAGAACGDSPADTSQQPVSTPTPLAGSGPTAAAGSSAAGAAGSSTTSVTPPNSSPSVGGAGSAGTKMTGSAGAPVAGMLAANGGSAAAGTGGSAGTAGTGAGGSGGVSAPGAGAGGSGGVSAPGAGGFPKSEEVNTARMGPHQFKSYTEGLTNPAYASSVVYYPTDAEPPLASVVFSPGYTATKEDYQNFLGPLLASHGIVILLTTPTSTSDQPPARADDLKAAIKQIATENTREGSPLKGLLAPERVCISGQSMGGGGTCIAANTLGNMIKCATPFEPWEPGMTFPKVSAPIMFIAAASDTVAAPAQNASPFYMSVPDSVPKYYVEFAGASHYLTTGDEGTNYDVQSKYLISFYKTYLEDDMRYLDVLNAPADKELSKYTKSK